MNCTYRVQKNPFNVMAGYYMLLLLVVTMHSRQVTTSNKRKLTAHIRSGIYIHRVKQMEAIFDALSLDRVYFSTSGNYIKIYMYMV